MSIKTCDIFYHWFVFIGNDSNVLFFSKWGEKKSIHYEVESCIQCIWSAVIDQDIIDLKMVLSTDDIIEKEPF